MFRLPEVSLEDEESCYEEAGPSYDVENGSLVGQVWKICCLLKEKITAGKVTKPSYPCP